jgi:hypothetical protein
MGRADGTAVRPAGRVDDRDLRSDRRGARTELGLTGLPVAQQLGEDPFADARIYRTLDDRVQQPAGVRFVQTLDHELGEAGEVLRIGLLPDRHDEQNPFCQQPPGNESSSLRRDVIERLRVVDEADRRLLLSAIGEQVQYRETDQEAIRGFPTAQAEGDSESDTCGSGRRSSRSRKRSAELMLSGVSELHLGLYTSQPNDTAAGRARLQVLEQYGLADPGLPA